MRLLFVTYRFPTHTHDASCNTVFQQVKYFSQRHQVSLVALAASKSLAWQRNLLAPYCHRIETVVLPPWRAYLNVARGLLTTSPLQMWLFWSRAMAARVRRTIVEDNIELAYAYHLRSGQYLADVKGIARCIALQPAQVLHFGRRKDYIANPIRRLGYKVEFARLRGYELRMAKKFERCLLISETDRRAIDPRGELENVFFNPHGVDTDYFAPEPSAGREADSLVFSGALSMDTNADAVLYFYRYIYPLVKRVVPGVKLYVVGKGPPAAVRALRADSSVVVTGYVEDLRPYLRRAQVGIDPLRIGAGLQNKVLEGMAVGLPMVISGVANEGIGATHRSNVLIADEPAEFAAAIVELLQNPSFCQTIAERARDFIARHWSWESHFAPLEQLFKTMIDEQRQRAK